MTSPTFPFNHPRSHEILALARSGDQDQLAAVLQQEGLPQDLFVSARDAELPGAGEVLIGSEVCAFSFKDHVLEIGGAVPFAPGLVQIAEGLDAWERSTQARAEGILYTSDHRTSMSVSMSEIGFGGSFVDLRERLRQCARFYACLNPFYVVGQDHGWELLRYEAGEKYGPHADVVPGATSARQLSCLVYLNSGFEGGETRFLAPGQERTIKPVTGKVVMFPASFTHPHESLPVAQGTKYLVAGWFYA